MFDRHATVARLMLAALFMTPLIACAAEQSSSTVVTSSASSTTGGTASANVTATSTTNATTVVQAVAVADPYPMVALANEHIALEIMLPDAANGYYRATRFDWSGLVTRVKVGEHTFYAPRTKKHNPKGHDDTQGTAEEFGLDATLGYDTAAVGETFVKIGVGELKKDKDEKYKFFKTYEFAKIGQWDIKQKPGQITFHQALQGSNGWAYDYTKTLTLDEKQAGVTIERTLKNTGDNLIEVTHYGHNFTVVDDQPVVGPQYHIEFDFKPESKEYAKPGIAKIEGQKLVLTQDLPPNKSIWGELAGFDKEADYKVRVVNTQADVAVEISGSGPVEKMVVWGMNPTICPEVFIPIKLEPGQSKTWKTHYLFEVGKKQ